MAANRAPTIYIVDDDAAVRAGVSLLVKVCGWRAKPYASAEEFLQNYSRGDSGCVMLDMQLPGMSGADLAEIMTTLDIDLPLIIVTAYKNHPLTDRALASGAMAVIEKPFGDEILVNTIERALEVA